MVWGQAEASCPWSARGTPPGRGTGWTGDKENADESQTEFGVFSWLQTQTVYTPQLPALKNGNLMEGLEGHKEDRKASDPAVLCPGTELAEHVGANDSQLFVDERPGHG